MSVINRTGFADFPFDKNTVYEAAEAALSQLKGFTLLMGNKESGQMMLDGKITWWSWGENITVHFTELAPGSTRVEVMSKPSMPTTLVDWGKNRRNVDKILAAIGGAL